MRYSEVFVPGGFPRHTYNPRSSRGLEERLKEVADNLCKLATVTGHTKSGKTVLVRGIFPPESSIWIDGGTVGDEDDFWSAIIEQLSLFQEVNSTSTDHQTNEIGGEGSAEANVFVAKGSGKITAKTGELTGTSQSSSRKISSRITAIAGLRDAKLPLVVDDFH